MKARPQGHVGEGEVNTQECRPDADAAGDAPYGEEVLGLKEVNCGEHLVPGDLRAGEPPAPVSGELLKARRSSSRSVVVGPPYEPVVEVDAALGLRASRYFFSRLSRQ